MKQFFSNRFLTSIFYLLIGSTAYSLAYTFFIAPQGIFAGGFTGVSQAVQQLLENELNLSLAKKIDLTGVILWLINVPLLISAYKHLSKHFVVKTLIVVLLTGFMMSVLPKISEPIIHDKLASCIVGGALAGYGLGLVLKSGGTSGGSDILGLVLSKHYRGLSVGKVGLTISLCLYAYLGLRFDLETAIYSIIYSFASSLIMDRGHYQNIQTAVIIISKDKTIGEHINRELKRGVTHWNGCGEYTKAESLVYLTMITKYESHKLTTLVKSIDPHAFLIFDDNREVIGNFEKRFDA